jgi:hypothetical protein
VVEVEVLYAKGLLTQYRFGVEFFVYQLVQIFVFGNSHFVGILAIL